MKNKILLLTGLLTSTLFADFTLEYKMEGNMKQIVQYKDAQHVMIITDDAGARGSGGQLIVGDKRYMVMKQGGKTKYMDMDVMMEQMKQMSAAFGGTAQEEEPADEGSSDFKVVKKGKSKILAGIKGQVWTIEYDEEGKKERLDIVVTNDDKVVDAIHKYLAVMKQFTQMGGEEDDGLSSIINISKGYVTIGFDGMELAKFDESDIADSVYALPKGMAVDTTSGKTATVKKPPLCAITGKVGEAKQLSSMLKPSANGWKQLSSAMCLNMMKMTVENAIYQKGDSYIHINLSINVEDEKGIVATYRTNNMEISDHKKGKIQGNRYQSAYLKMAKQNAIDIRLNNAMLTMSATGSTKVDLASFSDNVLDLSKFVPVKKSKATADDALKSLGGMFGGQGGSSNGNAPSNADMEKAGEMLKGLFGK